MSDESFFHAMLDDHPADHAARLLLSEWLGERGDERAEAYRWMALQGKYPTQDFMLASGPHTWDWWSMLPGWNGGLGDTNDRHDRVGPKLLRALEGYYRKSNWSGECAYCEFITRHGAEEAMCRAVATVPDDNPPTTKRSKQKVAK
jgi:uncharacterized protein (TIGR02996 family)